MKKSSLHKFHFLTINHFWSIEIEFSGIKSGQVNEFKSLGSQKIDFYVLGKQLNFQWKIYPLFKL